MGDPAFFVVLAVGLSLVSVMLVYRLGASGKGGREIASVIIHVWVVFALATLLFWATARIAGVGPEADSSRGVVAGLSELVARVTALGPREKMLLIGGWVVAIGLFVALLRRVNAAMREVPPPSP